MCLNRRRNYDATLHSIGAARDFVSAFAVAMLAPGGWSVADDAAVVVSELVTSALEAGCASVDVVADLHVDRLELGITGVGAAGPPEGLGGLRGAVVAQLASRADLARTPEGTLAGAALLPCRAEWTSAVPCQERG